MGSPDGLSYIELTTIADLLEGAASQYAEHGSNDYFVQASPANHAALEAAIKFNRRVSQDGDEPTLEEVTETNGTLFIYDHWLMDHLADRCRTILDPKSKRSSKRTTKNSRLSDAELLLTADLLASLAENSYALYEVTPGNEDLHLEPSPESTAFAAAVKRHAGAPDAIAQNIIGTAGSGQSVFVIDALQFLASRCHEAVGKPPAFDAGARSAESGSADDQKDRLGTLKTWMSEKILIERAQAGLEEHEQGSMRVDADLETYARGGNPFKDFHDNDHPEAPPHALSVGSAMCSTISADQRVVIKLFSNTTRVEWLSHLEQSTARRYWGLRIRNNRVLAVAGGQSFDAITLLADCLYLGWMNEAKALAETYRILYRKQRFNLNHQGFTLPLHHWLLRIAFDFWNLDFDGWGNFGGSKPKDKFAKGQCFGEPPLNEIFAHWRDVDLEPLRDRLIWLCDYYTHRTRHASEESREFEMICCIRAFPPPCLHGSGSASAWRSTYRLSTIR